MKEQCDVCLKQFPLLKVKFTGARFLCITCLRERLQQIVKMDFECCKARANLRAANLGFFQQNLA